MPVHVCLCSGKHLREKWFVANTFNSTYFVPDPGLMSSCVCYLLCPPHTVLCSWHDSYAHLKTRKLRPRHCKWLTDGLTATKCQDSRASAGRVGIFILKPGCLSVHWCLWAKKKKGKNKHPASPLNPDKGCSVTLPNPSLGYFLISCLIQSFPVWRHGQIHQSHAPMSVSHHFPGGGQILKQQGEQKGWIWGLIVPIQILWTSILLSSISGLLFKKYLAPPLLISFSEILQLFLTTLSAGTKISFLRPTIQLLAFLLSSGRILLVCPPFP